MMANDIMEPRHYSAGSIGLERTVLTDREMSELTRPQDSGVKIRGEVSIGVAKDL